MNGYVDNDAIATGLSFEQLWAERATWIRADTGAAVAGAVVIAEALPDLAALAMRARDVLSPPVGASPRNTAREAVEIILDVIELVRCRDGIPCHQRINQLRDILLGAIDGDYLRALGGVSAFLTAQVTDANQRKQYARAIALVASVISYIDTYRASKDEPAAEAREKRKKALEALIDANTDRDGRDRWPVISLGASVGYVGGGRYLVHADRLDAVADPRLALGVTVLGEKPCWPNYVHFALLDLGNFAASEGDKEAPDTRWSDVVDLGVQAGWAFGHQLPFVVGIDVSWAPRQRYSYSGKDDQGAAVTEKTVGAFRAGAFVGFDVPFFDLN